MPIACRAVVLLSLGLLVCCGPRPPSETVRLSRPSDFDTPLDNRWRKASETRPIAILLGRAETTRILMPRRAVLRVSCYRRPVVRVSYDVGLASGPIAVAYRFDSKTVQKGVVRVRGRHRNMLVIDDAATAAAFQADLRTSGTLNVRASRPPFDLHDAHFRARGLIEHVTTDGGEDVVIPAIAPQLSETPGRTTWPGPPLGAHNDEVYGGLLGLDAEAIADLKTRGVI